MRIAISNIAWDAAEEPEVVELLRKSGIRGVEVAPGKIPKKSRLPTEKEAAAYRRFWNEKGIEIVAMQALLFGRDDLVLFGTAAKRAELRRYLKKIIKIGNILGAGILVFGSPKNRARNGLSLALADKIAVPFFRDLGVFAKQNGVKLCIEHNPAEYGTDYIRTAAEALRLVKKVNHPGFGLHLDAGGLILSKDSDKIIKLCRSEISHFHISQPFLEPVGGAYAKKHMEFARALKSIKYGGWASIEMRGGKDCDNIVHIEKALEFAKRIYAS